MAIAGPFACVASRAAVTDIAATPMATSSSAVKPNLLFTLDASGSMAMDTLPDFIDASGNCKSRQDTTADCREGDPPHYAAEFNGIYYNPQIQYKPGLSYLGASFPDQSSPWTSVLRDYYIGGGTTINLISGFTEIKYCNASGVCYANGSAITGNPFKYNSATLRNGLPEVATAAGFLRGGTTVTVTMSPSTYPHGLADNSVVFANSSQNGLNGVFQITVPAGNATQFTYRTAASGTLNGGTRTFIPAAPGTGTGTFSRTAGSNLVTVVTPAPHGLVTGDIITTGPSDFAQTPLINALPGGRVNNVAITFISPTSFRYTSTATNAQAGTPGLWVRTGLYNTDSTVTGSSYYYSITPVEHCSDANLTICTLSSVPVGLFQFPAYVRYCQSTTDQNSPLVVTGGTPPLCQAKYVQGSVTFPRYGQFTRVDIVPGTPTYSNRPNRFDCASRPTCTYAEEMTNFANWYTYYRTRMQMMKTASGQAFVSLVPPAGNPANYRVGFITINPTVSGNVSPNQFLPMGDFAGAQVQNWYNKFYSQVPNSTTPLRIALSRAGRYFAGKTSGINAGISDDPVQFSCQQNFTILTTDGYWNDATTGYDINGSLIGNLDNVDDPFSGVTSVVITTPGAGYAHAPTLTFSAPEAAGGVTTTGTATVSGGKITGVTITARGTGYSAVPTITITKNPLDTITQVAQLTAALTTPGSSSRGLGTFDGGLAGATGTLADVAQYYYQTDLRPAGSIGALGADVSTDNVPTSTKDNNPAQHMVTFTLGLVDGLMTFRPDYESAQAGDFYNIKQGTSNGCFWTAGACNWPVPVSNQPSALDDLWHAAINGRGTFFQAKDPVALSQGLANALTGLNARLAAASAAATSSPNVTQTDKGIFSSTYETVRWDGELVAQNLDPTTGLVVPTVLWSAQSLLDVRVGAASDARTIYTFDDRATPNSNKLRNFNTTDLTAGEQSTYFSNKCTPLNNMTQCGQLNPTLLAQANSAPNMINFLRGQNGQESTVYRDRLHVLGDTVNAVPAYMRAPVFSYADGVVPDYTSFKTTNALRQATLFIGANDGMLHTFNADTGNEMWAYVPKMVFPGMYVLADSQYATRHRYFVDGSPMVSDMFDGTSWRTILVSGLNSGGRGYFAMDVTNPASPKALWEFCQDATLCALHDNDLGLSYGTPVLTKRAYDGKWVVLVTSGYNNIGPGNGQGYLYVLDPISGVLLEKVSTLAGNVTTPSGFAKIAVWADNGSQDNSGKWVYGGDLLGNVWRFDLRTSPISVLHIASLTDANGRTQPVTTRPELGQISNHRVLYMATGRYIGVSDLTDPASQVPASTDAWQQSLYAFKDNDTDYGNLRFAGGLIVQTISVLNGTTRSSSTNPVDWNTNNGWRVDFNPANQSPGERVNLDPQLVLGTLAVVTNVPDATACNIGGVSYLYQFNYLNGQYIATSPGSAVGTKLSNAITVGLVIVRLSTGQLKGIATDAGGQKNPVSINIGGVAATGQRVGWRELVQ